MLMLMLMLIFTRHLISMWRCAVKPHPTGAPLVFPCSTHVAVVWEHPPYCFRRDLSLSKLNYVLLPAYPCIGSFVSPAAGGREYRYAHRGRRARRGSVPCRPRQQRVGARIRTRFGAWVWTWSRGRSSGIHGAPAAQRWRSDSAAASASG